MFPGKENFEPKHSEPARGLTVALKIFLLSLFALIFSSLLGMIVFAFWIEEVDIRLIVLGFSVPVSCFFVWMGIAEHRRKLKRPKYTQIVVDDKGLHHYGKDVPVLSLLYESLQTNNEGGINDVLMTDGGYSEGDIDLYIFIKNQSGVIKAQPVVLQTTFLISNPNALRTHFIKGVMLFRPDLRIDPEALKWYRVPI